MSPIIRLKCSPDPTVSCSFRRRRIKRRAWWTSCIINAACTTLCCFLIWGRVTNRFLMWSYFLKMYLTMKINETNIRIHIINKPSCITCSVGMNRTDVISEFPTWIKCRKQRIPSWRVCMSLTSSCSLSFWASGWEEAPGSPGGSRVCKCHTAPADVGPGSSYRSHSCRNDSDKPQSGTAGSLCFLFTIQWPLSSA